MLTSHGTRQSYLNLSAAWRPPYNTVSEPNFSLKHLNEVKLDMGVVFPGLNRHPSSKNIYEKANRRVEKWSKFIYFYIVQISPLILLPKFIISFFYYFTTDVGNDSFELMISMWWVFRNNFYILRHWLNIFGSCRFPFDTNNPTGYILAFMLQYIMAFYLIFSTATMINLGIGTYLLATSLSNDLLADLHHFIECKLFSEGNKIQALKQIANFCRMHSTSKR